LPLITLFPDTTAGILGLGGPQLGLAVAQGCSARRPPQPVGRATRFEGQLHTGPTNLPCRWPLDRSRACGRSGPTSTPGEGCRGGWWCAEGRWTALAGRRLDRRER